MRRIPRCPTRAALLLVLVPVLTAVVSPAIGGPAPAEAVRATFAGFIPPQSPDGPAARANGRLFPVPTIVAHRLTGEETVKIDGRLDDSGWRCAEAGSGFTDWEPDRGKVPTEETVFKVAYDQSALYFAVACLEDDPSKVTMALSRRDQMTNTDLVSVYIDPYYDRTTGYNFRVNPLGVQQDAYMFNDGERDDDWDAVWQAETYRDRHGWYAEVRIPFSSIRYRQAQDTWGLQIYRYMHGRGEDTAWITWDRDKSGFVSRFGTLTGLRGIPAPRQLEILPYAVHRSTDPSAPSARDGIDNFEDFGADLKYGVTSDLTLNATFQPDFGQVEADPAVLNLSPFETFYDEKRPFFIEGSRFFEMPNFNLFYSRRIGTGSADSRIRYAAKVTGKTSSDVSVALLAASTDVTGHGQAHNFLKAGNQTSRYFVARLGREFKQGNARFHLMQTAVLNSADRTIYGDHASREAYTSGADFDLTFHDRKFEILGSFVGSVIDPEPLPSDPTIDTSRRYGTGGELDVAKRGGTWRASAWGRWESDRLELNDIGFLSAPDEMNTGFWIGYNYTPDGKSARLNQANLNYNFYRSWLYGARTGYDLVSREPVWTYGRGHRQSLDTNINGWTQFRNYREAWFGVELMPEGTQRYETRSSVTLENGDQVSIPGGGPLMSEPTTYGGWIGASTDTRKDLVVSTEWSHYRDAARNHATHGSLNLKWNESNAVNHQIGLGASYRVDDTQHIGNFENPGGGIGGVSYVFGKIHQKTVDVTVRTNLLFSRNKSLELYAQPYISVGNFTDGKELARPDSYDFLPYTRNGFRVSDADFIFTAVNVNAVYRWEYRPGSTLFLVWTHSRSSSEDRGSHAGPPGSFHNSLGTGALFNNEPENTILAKITYWIPI
jgi:hypothetical protein